MRSFRFTPPVLSPGRTAPRFFDVGELRKKKENPKHKRNFGPDGKPLYSIGVPTDKKEAFALAYVETRSVKKAYIRTYTAENMSDTSVRVAANKIMKDPFVIKRISELNDELAEETRLSLANLVKMLLDDRALAHREGQAAAAVQASMHVAKILGHYWDRKQVVISDDFDAMGIEELRSFVVQQTKALGIGKEVDGQFLIEHNPEEFEQEE